MACKSCPDPRSDLEWALTRADTGVQFTSAVQNDARRVDSSVSIGEPWYYLSMWRATDYSQISSLNYFGIAHDHARRRRILHARRMAAA